MDLKNTNWLAFVLEDNSLSMGRVMAWIMFGILVYMWLGAILVPETLITAFYVLLSYNFGKKIAGPLGNIMAGAMRKPQGLTEQDRKALVDEMRKSTEKGGGSDEGSK